MKTSESIIKISAALLKAQKDMEGAKKDSKNPFFKSKYADFNAVLEACKGPLNDNGITILQPHRVDSIEGKTYMIVETILLHESGEFLSSETQVVVAKANDPQSLGSAQTYSRRYGLQSFISLPAEDDDGETAMNRSGKAKSPSKTPNKASSGFSGKEPAKASGFGDKPKEPVKARAGSFGS